MKQCIFYHAPCSDGFGAAWAFWKKYQDTISYYPLGHKDFPEFMLESSDYSADNLAQEYEKIYFVDICPPADVIKHLQDHGIVVIVIDHHISAKNIIENLKASIYDDTKSGAVLAWEYCFPETELPLILELVQDRDLHQYNFQHTRPILAMLDLEPFDFIAWDKFNTTLDSSMYHYLLISGNAIEQFEANQRKSFILAEDNVHSVCIDGHIVPAVNTLTQRSEIANLLAKDAPAGACYYKTKNSWVFSLRSDKNNPHAIDVAELAARYGGGGHRHASGFRVTDITPFMVTE